MYTDEHIEYWGEVFVAHDLGRYMAFAVFLCDPHGEMAAIAAGYRPLLPRQRAVQQRIDAEAITADLTADIAERAVLRNQALVEPIHRHAWDVSRVRQCNLRRPS